MLFISKYHEFDENCECLIYTSHEETISFTGDIADKMKNKILKNLAKDILQ